MTRNIKLTVEYDGTNYHGWQSQAGTGSSTVQDTLEQALQALTNEGNTAIASGRTDAGVHARGQVVNFHTGSSLPVEAWVPALNHLLPGDVRVLAAEEVPRDFHARFSARGKIYQYRILNRRPPSALYRYYAWHVNLPLDMESMTRASAFLLGTHDFSAFRGSGCAAKSPVRTLRSAKITRSGDFIDVLLEADAFLQYMVRNIVGTLVETGLGRFKPEQVKEMLLSRNRCRSGRTAPPHGLYLVTVFYEGS
ncbi:MAG: tRNA pseudouridine(38-40) synthase TruA [Nitrospirae bacterium GWD2_57_9]|nr:MAG: tRNA pseudouridine(38-40) synthase TruA [Nitrospirae bacterium GWD2_57_9]OGW51153.1 MAG: tRNA pseudouridine(38-40) synthase TruA [Nitrospirae bacterium GWC2_57_9]